MTSALILASSSPVEARCLAKSIKATKERYTEWQRVKFDIFDEGNRGEFSKKI